MIWFRETNVTVSIQRRYEHKKRYGDMIAHTLCGESDK